ncbi:MAG: hypothetical protein A3F78_05740 [Burkholderiales bacterium RIFCSPLOWO2_12_FULL_61_40]|nr:MAG: hypothetical protein A3F78_05740 [Burkholderiales bacterium RIFCSPLOWO2_12_FULL_61_40]
MRLPIFSRLRWLFLASLVAAVALWLAYGRMPAHGVPPAAELDDFCVVAPPTPYDPKSGRDPLVPRPVPADARCPVCGMFPARSPEWAAQVIFSNGDAQFFDSPLTLFIYLQDVGRYSIGRQANEIAASYVNDADRAGWIRTTDAFYVHGSNALGPMRLGNLPAFSSAAGALRFARVRGGAVLRASEIKPPLLHTLMVPRRHAHTEQARE